MLKGNSVFETFDILGQLFDLRTCRSHAQRIDAEERRRDRVGKHFSNKVLENCDLAFTALMH